MTVNKKYPRIHPMYDFFFHLNHFFKETDSDTLDTQC